MLVIFLPHPVQGGDERYSSQLTSQNLSKEIYLKRSSLLGWVIFSTFSYIKFVNLSNLSRMCIQNIFWCCVCSFVKAQQKNSLISSMFIILHLQCHKIFFGKKGRNVWYFLVEIACYISCFNIVYTVHVCTDNYFLKTFIK